MDENTILEKGETNKFFKNIKQTSSNNTCADCKRSSPIWVTITYSLFICSDCAAKHREMGVKKSKVKSTLLDKWSLGECRRVYVGGNKRGHRLGDERDLRIKYMEAEWYINDIDKLVNESIKNEEGKSFLDILNTKSANTSIKVNNDIKEVPLPKFGDDSCILEEKKLSKSTSTKKVKPVDVFVIKKKNTPTLSKSRSYETDDEFRDSRLGFGSDFSKK